MPDQVGAKRLLVLGLWLALLGAVLSGPVSLVVVELAKPQGPWTGAASFAERYHPLQQLPFWLGLALVSGLLTVVAGLHRLASASQKPRTTLALLLAAAFGALIFTNYVLQTTFVPVLAQPFEVENAALISALSMANPRSLAWGLEMWGYGLAGVATWLCAEALPGAGISRRVAVWCFVANGPVSVVGALATAWDRGWLMRPFGLAAFALWNVLVIAMCGAALASLRRASS